MERLSFSWNQMVTDQESDRFADDVCPLSKECSRHDVDLFVCLSVLENSATHRLEYFHVTITKADEQENCEARF